tara:strand:+ start:98 stop:601 length:504 start_codon:yes stop_codon:yes gene_type:complete
MGLFDIFKNEKSSRVEKLKKNFSSEKEKQRKKEEISNTKKLEKYKILKDRFEAIVLDEDFKNDLAELMLHFDKDKNAKKNNYKCNYVIEKHSDGELRLEFLKNSFAFCQGYIHIKSNSQIEVGDFNHRDGRKPMEREFNYQDKKLIQDFFLKLITGNMSQEEPGLDT